jgi:pyridinium-3,5-biscarboxylic acid mononucleotide synthase
LTDRLRELLESVKAGKVDVDAAMHQVEGLPFEDIGFAHVDHHRALRKGFPEVIFCQGKTIEQVVEIGKRIAMHGSLLATRASDEQASGLVDAIPGAEHQSIGRTVTFRHPAFVAPDTRGRILVLSAGTSDLPVAEEAATTADIMGNDVERVFDVGVAGIHRLLAYRENMADASVLIVVAGMEGALPSVVGGMVNSPVIAVPTSVGYGASFGGLAALLGMLNTCSAGVTVVNIDNGFGAGYSASLMNRS